MEPRLLLLALLTLATGARHAHGDPGGTGAVASGPTSAERDHGVESEVAGPPSYFVVPLHGVVGQEIVASVLEEAFEAGLRDGDTVLVLDIDSPGGLVSECEEIINLLSRERERRSIAYVRRALSAAAIISLACDEIYMHRDATIGAATAIQQTVFGAIEVEEKMKSVWRATCRRAAEIGGHDPLFAESMVDAKVQLRVVEDNGERKIEQVLRARDADLRAGRIITERGKLFTVTAREAEECGLAQGVVDDLEAVAKVAPGLSGWKLASTRGTKIVELHNRRFRAAVKRMEEELETAEEEFNLAIEFDPNRQEYRLGRGRRFTRESRAKWLGYTRACYEHLGRCERALGNLEDLMVRYPIFQLRSEVVSRRKKEIEDFREAIKRGARRRGI